MNNSEILLFDLLFQILKKGVSITSSRAAAFLWREGLLLAEKGVCDNLAIQRWLKSVEGVLFEVEESLCEEDGEMCTLFVRELERQVLELNKGLLEWEGALQEGSVIESLMRAAHAVKGVARVMRFHHLAAMVHAIEDAISAGINSSSLELLFEAVDLLTELSRSPPNLLYTKVFDQSKKMAFLRAALEYSSRDKSVVLKEQSPHLERPLVGLSDGALRVDQMLLSSIVSHAAEVTVGVRSLLATLESFQQKGKERALAALFEGRIIALSTVAEKLYRQSVMSRMRSFHDIAMGFPRVVRDLAKELNKEVRFEILGGTVLVDRELLEQLEVYLVHLLKNAIDHGIELPEERIALGKLKEGAVALRVSQGASMVVIECVDDGRGSSICSDELFLGHSSKGEEVTEISGRGVGLRAIEQFVKGLGGTIQCASELGKGFSVCLRLPLMRSIIKALVVWIGGGLYAFPLIAIDRVVREYPGAFCARTLLGLPKNDSAGAYPAAYILCRGYGIAIDCLVGEQELVVRRLGPQFRRFVHVDAGAIGIDGEPILILNVQTLVASMSQQVN